MTFGDYQLSARLTAIYPQRGANLVYPALGLLGEAGEVSEKIKKHWRGTKEMGQAEMAYADKEAIAKELGDVLWYVATIATELNWDLDAIASANLKKLKDRANRDVIKGEGDNR